MEYAQSAVFALRDRFTRLPRFAPFGLWGEPCGFKRRFVGQKRNLPHFEAFLNPARSPFAYLLAQQPL
jgi:hypothetical protein